MTSPDAGLLRLARASGFGLVAFALSVAAHAAGGGQLPSAVTSLVLVGACCWLSVFLTWRPLGIAKSVLALAALQVPLHAALMLTSVTESCVGMMPAHPHSPAAASMSAMCLPGAIHAPALAGPGMTLAHGSAAVLLAVLLSRADRAVWFLVTLRLWAPPAEVQVCPSPVAGPVVAALPPCGRGRLAVLDVRRRGPPSSLAPALGLT
jgi:hypothetical protein